MPKRPKKHRTGRISSPVSPLAPLETQRLGQGIAGLFLAFDLFWSGISGRYKDPWYDRVLHVVGGLLILGGFIGGAILLFWSIGSTSRRYPDLRIVPRQLV
jgi:hypothetical protein